MRQLPPALSGTVSVVLALAMCAPTNDLVSELRDRYDREGLTLVDWNNEYLDCLRFGDDPQVFAPYPFTVLQISHCRFSPNGRAIAVTELDDSHISIYDMKGKLLARSAGEIRNCINWAVSFDLSNIALCGSYVTHSVDNRSELKLTSGIVTVKLSTDHLETAQTFSHYGVERFRCGQIWWSPDGRNLVYEYDKVIYVWDVDRKNSRFLVNGRMPSWSPDGKWIAFRNTDGNLQLITPEGTFGRVLYSGGDVGGGVKWSPDGRYIAFGINQYIPPYENSRLMVLRVADGRMAKVTGYWDREIGGRHMWAYLDFSKTPWMRPAEWHEKRRRDREQRENEVKRER